MKSRTSRVIRVLACVLICLGLGLAQIYALIHTFGFRWIIPMTFLGLCTYFIWPKFEQCEPGEKWVSTKEAEDDAAHAKR